MFADYYRSLKYSDAFLKITVNNGFRVLPIHKVILASQSTFFDDLFSKSASYATELHYGRRLPTFILTFGERQTYFLTNVIEWLYVKRVPSLSNDTVWCFLELLNILCIPTLENIVFQYIEQRVSQFGEHFPLNGWRKYIKDTSLKRPSFLRLVLKTYFIDCDAKDAFEKYEAARDIIISQSLDQDMAYLIMDVVPFQDLSILEIKHIVKENVAPQALSLLEKMDSGVDIDRIPKEHQAIEELRNQLQNSAIANKPMEILSLASEAIDDEDIVEEYVQEVKSRERNVRLSTSQTLKAASEKLLELFDNQGNHVSRKVLETNLIDPNNSFVDNNGISDIKSQDKSKKTGFGFIKFKSTAPAEQYGSSRPQSFLLDRNSSSQTQFDFGHQKVQFIPPQYTNPDHTRRNRSQSNVPIASTNTLVEDPSRRNRSLSTHPLSDQDASSEFKSTHSMYNLGDPEFVVKPDRESSGKRVGIMDLIKGLF